MYMNTPQHRFDKQRSLAPLLAALLIASTCPGTRACCPNPGAALSTNSGCQIHEIHSIVEEISDHRCCTCTYRIAQEDINGGTFTIDGTTNPAGVYCVAENLTATSSHTSIPIIEITIGQVTLDLCGHTIDGASTASDCIVIAHGTSGCVTVKNGCVTGAAATTPTPPTSGNGIRVSPRTSPSQDTTSWLIDDIYALSNDVNGILVQNRVSDGVIRDCTTDQNSAHSGMHIGESASDIITNIVIENCIARENGDTPPPLGFGSGYFSSANTNSADITIKNCCAQRNAAAGFYLENGRYNALENCTSIANPYGIYAEGDLQTVALTKHNSVQEEFGIVIGGEANPNYATVKNCIVTESGSANFYIRTEVNYALADCVAVSVSQDTATSFLIHENDSSVKNCVAVSEPPDTGTIVGFDAAYNGRHFLEHCTAVGYGTGFQMGGPCTSVVRACSALAETSAFDLGRAVTRTIPAALRDCLAIAGDDNATSAAFYVDSDIQTLITTCDAVARVDGLSSGFLVTNSTTNTALRGNTAIGFNIGFDDGWAASTSPNAYFNNLARGNTTNFSAGINTSGVFPFGYWIGSRNGTVPIPPDTVVALTDKTGYWTNVADPQY